MDPFMDFIPYSCQQITDEDIEAVVMALRSEYLTQGPIGPAFEAAFAAFVEAAYCWGVTVLVLGPI